MASRPALGGGFRKELLISDRKGFYAPNDRKCKVRTEMRSEGPLKRPTYVAYDRACAVWQLQFRDGRGHDPFNLFKVASFIK